MDVESFGLQLFSHVFGYIRRRVKINSFFSYSSGEVVCQWKIKGNAPKKVSGGMYKSRRRRYLSLPPCCVLCVSYITWRN
jgi:hypothetical protein